MPESSEGDIHLTEGLVASLVRVLSRGPEESGEGFKSISATSMHPAGIPTRFSLSSTSVVSPSSLVAVACFRLLPNECKVFTRITKTHFAVA